MKPPILIIVILFCGITYGQKVSKNVIKYMPPVSLFDIKGDTTNLLNLGKGKVTFIDFWFIPCVPCFEEMTMLHKINDTYKSNINFKFLTITYSDSSFVRNLIENRNTEDNDVYDYFKAWTKLDTFRLPVYFTKNYTTKMKLFKKNKTGKGFSGLNWPNPKENKISPDSIFGFLAYPTILIFDKTGKLVFNKTGFIDKFEVKDFAEIIRIINSIL